uniref:Uncharacterized protein n=1 Tax=Amphimedon queenslandica TaxID=400682 RepID=A0A1X7TDW2_AMPQE
MNTLDHGSVSVIQRCSLCGGYFIQSFPILEVHFLKYSTREIYRNYIDCVRWFGRLAFSKSCENSLILWRPPRPDDKPQQKSFQVLQKFEVLNCEIWYIRFAMDRKMK